MMTTFLDIRTIIFGYVLTDMICLLVMAFLWRQSRNRIAGTTYWLIDYVCQTIALFLIVIRGAVPDWMSIVLAHTLVLTGALLGYVGLLRFTQEKMRQIPNILLIALLAGIHGYFTFVSPNLAVRNLNTSLGLFVVCSQCAWLLLYKVAPSRRKAIRMVGVVFLLYCLISGLRVIEFIADPTVRTDYFQPSTFDALAMIAYQILFIFLTYSLVLMFNDHLIDEIQTEQEKFSKAFHSSPYAITISRLSDDRIIEINEGFRQITGYLDDEVQGSTSFDLRLWCHEEDRNEVIRELSQRATVRNREYPFRKKNGEIITCIFSAELITVSHETCILSSINDISDRKKIEGELRRNELLLRTVMDNLPIGVAVNSIDPGVKFEYMNDNFATFYRTTKEVLQSDDGFWEAAYEDPRQREEIKNQVMAACASGDPQQMSWPDVPITRKGSIIAYVSARNIPIPGEKLMISAVWDVTEQKRIQRKIRSLNEQLELKVADRTRELHDTQLALLNLVDDLNETTQKLAMANTAMETANKELEAFSYSVSHDLRAPLRSIDGFSQALLEDYADKIAEEGRNYLERIRRATQHMGRLIDDMLKLSRVTRAEFSREEVDLSALAAVIMKREQSNHPERSVEVIVQEGLNVLGDRNLMEIALTNLIGNAWKFTGKTAYPRIEFGSIVEDEKIVYYVRDNGVGFDMSYVNKLFGTFQRLHKKEDFDGTGVGLATVKRIVVRHGGEIWARSKINAGATFFFTLSQ